MDDKDLKTLIDLKSTKWYDRCCLIHVFHSVRCFKYGKANRGRKKEGWSLRDTAKELGFSVSFIHSAIECAEHFQLNPELREYDNVKEAMDAIRARKRSLRRATDDSKRLPESRRQDRVL